MSTESPVATSSEQRSARSRAILAALAIVSSALVGSAEVATAADYYVDNARYGSGDGRSWATAWPSLGAIDWRRLAPGDTLNVSGGTRAKVYRETLTVATSGVAERRITIRAAVEPGHDGDVIIDAENRRPYGVVVDRRNHLTVNGLAIRNSAEAGVLVRRAAAGVIVEAMAVAAGMPRRGGNSRGYDVRDSAGVVVRGSSYVTPSSTPAQTDGIFSTNNDGVRFVANRLVIANNYQGLGEGHNDCIQSYRDIEIAIVGNYCEQRNLKQGHSLGIFVQNIHGTAFVADNIVVSPNTASACIAVENLPDFDADGRMLAYNNSAYGCANGTMHIVRSPGSVAYNNILFAPKSGAQAMKLVPPAPPPTAIDHNLLYSPNSATPVLLEGAGLLTWAQWRARGYDANGVFGDPGFVDVGRGDLSIRPTSPARGRGRPLDAETADRIGIARPTAAPLSIGALERRASSSGSRSASSRSADMVLGRGEAAR